jgi:hypothetical protein
MYIFVCVSNKDFVDFNIKLNNTRLCFKVLCIHWYKYLTINRNIELSLYFWSNFFFFFFFWFLFISNFIFHLISLFLFIKIKVMALSSFSLLIDCSEEFLVNSVVRKTKEYKIMFQSWGLPFDCNKHVSSAFFDFLCAQQINENFFFLSIDFRKSQIFTNSKKAFLSTKNERR